MRVLQGSLSILHPAVIASGLLGSGFAFAGELNASPSDSLFVD